MTFFSQWSQGKLRFKKKILWEKEHISQYILFHISMSFEIDPVKLCYFIQRPKNSVTLFETIETHHKNYTLLMF